MFDRIKILLTGRVLWCNPYTNEVEEVDHMGWRDRWNVFGVHSYNWRWVNRYGAMPCGCTRNPITRRRVLLRWGCPDHAKFDRSDAALFGDDQ